MFLNSDDTILFQGDSITDGNRGRNNDPNHILGHGYACMVASRLGADNYTRQPNFINRGESGDTIKKMYGRWKTDVVLLNPTIVSILIGVNDTCCSRYFDHAGNGLPKAQYERIYRQIIEDTKEALPRVKLILCEPFYICLDTEEETRRIHGQKVRKEVEGYQEVVKKIADSYGCVFVPFQDLFDELTRHTKKEYIIWDGVHPTMTGHEFMARRWLEVVEKALEKTEE